MNAKILIVVIFLFSFSIYSQKTLPPKTNLQGNSKIDQTSDELLRHLSAAETFQISGDLTNASIENKAIIGIALQRAGNIAIEEGNYQSAVEILSQSLSYSDTAQDRTNLAVAYQRLNQVDKAIAEARVAVAKDPKFTNAHYLLGNILYMKEDYQAALPELENVMRTAPDLDVAQALALTYLNLKQLERAKLLFEEIRISTGSDKADIHLLFARAYERTNYPVEAEREIRRALAIDPKQSRAYFYLGYLILQQGGSERLSEAGAAFAEELKTVPNDFFSNFFAGVVASSENEHAKAIKYLEKAIQINGQSGEAYLFLGQSQIETNDLAAAESNLRKAIVLEGGKPEKDYQSRRTHFLLGRLLAKTGRKDEAEKELKLSRELQERSIQNSRDEINQILGKVVGDSDNRTVAALDQGSPKVQLSNERSNELKRIRAYLNGILAQAFNNLGVIAVQSGNSSDALVNFEAASKWNPDLSGLDRNWGIVSFRARQFVNAVGPLSRHLKTTPQDKLARQMLGASYYFTGDFAGAASTLKPIESEIVSDAELAYFYCISLIQLKRNTEALPVFNKMAELYQKDAGALFYAAQGFMILGDYSRAVKELKTVLDLDPRTAKANFFIGQSYIRLNLYDEAEKAFQRELDLDPTDASSKYHLALTLIERKIETERAISTLVQAIELKYDYADARYQLGKIFLEKGDTAKAIEQLEIAATSEPQKDYIHYQLGIAYRKAARPADADRELKRYQELKAANRKTDSPM